MEYSMGQMWSASNVQNHKQKNKKIDFAAPTPLVQRWNDIAGPLQGCLK